jgi:hypothetical protein
MDLSERGGGPGRPAPRHDEIHPADLNMLPDA